MDNRMLADGFLEHNSWLPGVVVAVVLFALTWLINLKLRQRDRKSKTFDHCVLSDVAILSHRPEDSQLKVTYLDQDLDNPRVVQVKFANSGTEVIRASEVLEQFVVSVGDAWLVSVEMAHSSSPNLAQFEATASPSGHEIRLTLATLNPGDNFTLQMLVDCQTETAISVSGRIEGETRLTGTLVTEAEKDRLSLDAWSGVFLSAMLISFGAALLISAKDMRTALFLAAFPSLLGMFAGAGAWATFTERRVRLRDGVLFED
jgi:hypothetical protein